VAGSDGSGGGLRVYISHTSELRAFPEGTSYVAGTEAVMAEMTRVLGPDHTGTLSARHNLADWRGKAGDPAGAVTAYTDLLAGSLKVLGPNHPDTLDTRRNLACWRGEAGAAAEAADALREVVEEGPIVVT
jgi:Tetratricopeptide repeat